MFITVITICYGLCPGFGTIASDYCLTKAKAESTSRAIIVLWICGPWYSVNEQMYFIIVNVDLKLRPCS